jgi:hypothetical protein
VHPSPDAIDYVAVVGIGALVGIGELVARYRDAPARALGNLAALVYVVLNSGAAAGALALAATFDWTFGASEPQAIRWTRVLVAGFGAMALFRSALFTVRVGKQDVGVGPSTFLHVVLTAADRAVDRNRARARAEEVSKAMSGVDFDKAVEALPAYCFALMQNTSNEEQRSLAADVAELRRADGMDDHARSLTLGLALMNIVGSSALVSAVRTLYEPDPVPARRREAGWNVWQRLARRGSSDVEAARRP